MAINPTQIRRQLRDFPVRGANVISISEGSGGRGWMDLPRGGNIRMAGSQGAGGDSDVSGSLDKRAKYRKMKTATRVTDVALLGLWVAFALWIWLS